MIVHKIIIIIMKLDSEASISYTERKRKESRIACKDSIILGKQLSCACMHAWLVDR